MAGVYQHHEKEFGQLLQGSAKLETLYSDCRWAEGPCWFGDANQLVWSDIPNNRMLRWTPDGGASTGCLITMIRLSSWCAGMVSP